MSYTDARSSRGTTLGDICASAPTSGFVKSQPAIAVKSPSFKAPKVVGKKPPIVVKGKLKAGGPGSGRKPNIGKDPQLNKMHNTLTRQGFTYRDSTNKKDSSGNYVDHAYTNSDHTKVAHLEDHENGNHQVRTNPTSAAD